MNAATTASRTAAGMETRILKEGYGEGAWHGPDLKAALADVEPAAAFWRPAPGRHNIAEIAVHHAYCVRNARAKISGVDADPFVLDGDDWFALAESSPLSWADVKDTVEREQSRLAALVADVDAGRVRASLEASEYFDIVLGITCHAVYHAGQIQLIKRLKG